MDRRPVIALTVGVAGPPWRAEEDRGRFLPYAASVRASGGEPAMVGIERSAEILADPQRFLGEFDGLLLTGGGDVHPASFPNPPQFAGRTWDQVIADHHMRVDEGRDAMELALARAALDADTPLLGICRGFQLLNILLGGGLILHLDPALGHSRRPDNTSSHHPVDLLPDADLTRILGGRETLPANSRHHQGVDANALAPLARPAALAGQGVIEAIEVPAHPWAVGVQWHPERPEDAEIHEVCRPLFDDFIAACRGGKGDG